MQGKVSFVPSPVAERPSPALKKTRAPAFTRETLAEKSRRAAAVAAHLAEVYPGVECPLIHRNTFELLVAVILSAQCTDAAVNQVTPALFARYPSPTALARASINDIEALIRRLGLFRAKARSLKCCAQQLVDEFGGEVPSSMDDLTRLAGVGRKTANVIRGHAFNLPGIAVDTHCRRLSRRLGFTRQQDPVKIERDLSRLLAPEEWTDFSHRLILHGRAVCHARKPECGTCTLRALCPSCDQDADTSRKTA
jgi:endonuclease-3